VTAIEAAVGIALVGSVLAVAVPAFVHNLSSSRLTEATIGVTKIGEHAIANAAGKSCADAFPPRAPLTPANVPRGKPAVDPDPDPWQHPTWRALDFRPSPPGVAHSYAFGFDSDAGSFVAHAHGDLDGDGTTSTFEVHGKCDSNGASLVPGMVVDSELE
jgi:type II secretory pathway pseudopilin PulG